MNLQIFSQDTNSVQVKIIDGKEFIVMTPDRAREISSYLIDKDSCTDRNIYLESKVCILTGIITGDSLDISNLNVNLSKCELQKDRYVLKERYVSARIKLMKDDIKFLKRQRIKLFIEGLFTGVVTGLIIK